MCFNHQRKQVNISSVGSQPRFDNSVTKMVVILINESI